MQYLRDIFKKFGFTDDSKDKVYFLLVILPLLIYISAVLIFSINIPADDDYDAVLGFLNKFVTSNNLGEKVWLLFSQHNEHRIFFNRVVELLQYCIMGKANFYILSIIGNLGWIFSFFVFYRLYKKKYRHYKYLLPISIIFFSFLTHTLMSWSMASIQQYYQVLFLLLSYYFLVYKFSIKSAILYQFFLTLGVWTGGGGLIFYIPAVVYLFFKKRNKEAIFTAILFLLNSYFYFIFFRYHLASSIPSFSYVPMHLFDIVIYSLNFIGNVKIITRYEYIVGLIFLLCSIYIAFKKRCEFQILILLAVGLTAFAVAIDRIHLGIWQALSSRYTMYPIILLSSNYLSILSDRNPKAKKYFYIFSLVLSVLIFSIAMPNGVRNLIKYDSDLKSKCIYYFDKEEHAVNIYEESHRLGIYNLSCYKK
ncbi:hypothetical protein Thena_0844 [Thermodesulfobium narugense DSM 14796]|uniref:Glycosyltransferase RgtA/B/C/D-like domain-containing protein n=1 Tax=Thermodesulfobium narugense DSM 14796 TaxID=747365 RepID=M1E8H0_9BACT|nr:hypothetical protein [Thermodesulfobium narugense]AEE14474.1 hypothetical protein Thena_0844 [Thermodesulfobium narugense DSM 14796]